MRKRTPPCPMYPRWTTSVFWSFIRSGLRAKFTRWPPKYELYNDDRRTVVGQRHKYEYQCAVCLEWFKMKEVEVDHIVKCGSLKKYEDLHGFVERLFVPKNKLQLICKPCHKAKTKLDRELT